MASLKSIGTHSVACSGMLVSPDGINADIRSGTHAKGCAVTGTLHRKPSQVEKGQEVTIHIGTRPTHKKINWSLTGMS